MLYGFPFYVWNYWWSCAQQCDHRAMSVTAMKVIGPEEDEEVRLIEITSLSENNVQHRIHFSSTNGEFPSIIRIDGFL